MDAPWCGQALHAGAALQMAGWPMHRELWRFEGVFCGSDCGDWYVMFILLVCVQCQLASGVRRNGWHAGMCVDRGEDLRDDGTHYPMGVGLGLNVVQLHWHLPPTACLATKAARCTNPAAQ